jgi:hypothetical protein
MAGHERVVMVPWAPRPLIVPGEGERRPGGLDRFVDELLEPGADEPRWFDVALLAGGAGLFVGSTAGAGAANLAFTGAMACLLGCIGPARTAWRTHRRRRARRRQDGALAYGLPLVASHPVTAALVAAYEQLLEVGALPGATGVAQEATVAAHLAVVEVATMLDGRPPGGVAEEEYVRQRTTAIERLGLALEREHQDWLATLAASGGRVPDRS